MSDPGGKGRSYRYVIIGNSAGGIGAVEAIRQLDTVSDILMVSDEPLTAYSRPMIAEYLAGEKDEDQILYRPADFYGEQNVGVMVDTLVEDIDLDTRKIVVKDKEGKKDTLGFGKLLLATGGVPFVPPMDGVDLKGIHTFVTIDDARGIKEEIGDVEKVLVVGGGLIGICVTEALVKLGKKVTIVELLDRVLSMNLDLMGSGFLGTKLEENGVDLVLGDSVVKFYGKGGRVRGAELKSGKKIDCDQAIVAIGVRPRIDLVKETAVKVNRGIIVDRHMETSVKEVFACGDAAEAYDFVFDENRLSPIWPNAYLGGRIAGKNMAGVKTEYSGSTGMTSFTYFDLPIVSAGMHTPPEDEKGSEILTRIIPGQGFYRKIVLKDGAIKGMIMVGDVKGAGVITDLMRDKVDVGSFKDNLLEGDLGVAHLPKDMIPSRLRGDH